MTALYVEIDNKIGRRRCLGKPPLLSGSELGCLRRSSFIALPFEADR
ncbi:hypothetical protein KI385_42185 [Streptomyces inhibens]|nr:hypothetical protein [Streptomyces inhibens]UKY54752.1 hypothetical protein KI385_42185 [Streptomyces inhibens]